MLHLINFYISILHTFTFTHCYKFLHKQSIIINLFSLQREVANLIIEKTKTNKARSSKRLNIVNAENGVLQKWSEKKTHTFLRNLTLKPHLAVKMIIINSSSEVEDINNPIQNTRLWFTEYFIKKRSWTSISLKKIIINYKKYITMRSSIKKLDTSKQINLFL